MEGLDKLRVWISFCFHPSINSFSVIKFMVNFLFKINFMFSNQLKRLLTFSMSLRLFFSIFSEIDEIEAEIYYTRKYLWKIKSIVFPDPPQKCINSWREVVGKASRQKRCESTLWTNHKQKILLGKLKRRMRRTTTMSAVPKHVPL